MEKLVVKGPTPLKGEVTISGAKNAAVALLPATLLIDGVCTIENLPNISDIKISCEILEKLGAKITWNDEHSITIDTTNITTTKAPLDLTSKFRASYYIIGAMLSRKGEIEVGMPGGCKLGARPIDQHIKGFELLGATVNVEKGKIYAKAKKLKGCPIYMDVVSVGATINVMLAAVLAKGTTIIDNAAKEPHIVDVANFLNTMGADIRGAGTDVIKINGVEKLHSTQYKIMGDRIEAFTYMVAALITNGELILNGIDFYNVLETPINILKEIGADIENIDNNTIKIKAGKNLKAVNVKTDFYPGFPTDCQASLMALLGVVKGQSIIDETIYENRFMHVQELNRLSANITTDGNKAIINGVKQYSGANVMSSDLRAGMALVLAGLSAKGKTVVDRIYHIERGYENFVDKLKNCGADLEIFI